MVIIMYICICNGITDNEIRNAIDSYHHELNVHHNDNSSKNHDSNNDCGNDIKLVSTASRQHIVSTEQAESNSKIKPQVLSELDYIKEKLDFDFCCGKCQCMVNDIIHNYNKVDIKS